MRAVLLLLLLSPAVHGEPVHRDVTTRVQAEGRARVFVLMKEGKLLPESLEGVDVTDRFSKRGAFAAEVDAAGVAALADNPHVAAVDLDVDGGGADLESLPLIGGNAVQAMGLKGDGVVVAVLDSGIDLTHADFAGAVIDEQCFCRNADGSGCCPNGQTAQSGPGSARDDHGHGTNVTGIVGGRGAVAPVGVAPGVKIVAVRVLDHLNRFSGISQVISGLEWVAANHPEARVVNMSLLTSAHYSGASCDNAASFNQTLAQIIGEMRSRGTAVFACSGNTANSNGIGSPACIGASIAVGAVYDSNVGPASFGSVCSAPSTAADQITCFSDSSEALDLLAPGAPIRSSGLGGATSTYQGTSQATPHAAGAAAILFAMNPALSATAVESILKTTGKPIVDGRNGITRPRIDLLSAVQAVQSLMTPRKRAARP